MLLATWLQGQANSRTITHCITRFHCTITAVYLITIYFFNGSLIFLIFFPLLLFSSAIVFLSEIVTIFLFFFLYGLFLNLRLSLHSGKWKKFIVDNLFNFFTQKFHSYAFFLMDYGGRLSYNLYVCCTMIECFCIYNNY